MISNETDSFSECPLGRGNVVCRQVDDGFILYDSVAGKVHSLNPTAAFIWDALDGKHSLREISKNIESLVGSEGHDTLADVEKVVSLFQKEDLLEHSENLPYLHSFTNFVCF